MGLFNKKSKRTTAIEKFSGNAGLTFRNKDKYGHASYFKSFKLFKYASGGSVSNLTISQGDPLDGQHGFFDYRYMIHTGQTVIIYDQTVFFVVDKEVIVPNFYLFPEAWHHRISKWFGTQDINFERYPDFSESYMLQSEDEEFTRILFDDEELIQFFEEHAGWSFEATGYYMIMYRHAKLQKIEELDQLIKSGHRLNGILRRRSKSLHK